MAEQTKPAPKKKSKPAPLAPPVDTSPAGSRWIDPIAGLLARFERFAWDLMGILLVAAALVLGLGLLGLTGGALLSPLSGSVLRWFGWGSGLLVLGIAGSGVLCLWHGHPNHPRLSLTRALALEGTGFTLLALLSALGGGSLERAEAGLDGGLTGWGLAQIPLLLGFGTLAQVTVLILLLGGFGLAASGLIGRLRVWVHGLPDLAETQIRDPLPWPDTALLLAPQKEALPVAQKAPNPPAPARKPEPPGLPEEFRKSFRVPAAATEATGPPPPRSELLPPLDVLIPEQSVRPDERQINLTAGQIEKTLAEFGVPGRVVGFRIGPTVTQFALEPGFVEKPGPDGNPIRQKVRVSQISALGRDLALALSAERLRIEAPVPGHAYMGVEVPNARSTIVRLRPILESEAFFKCSSPLAIALGRDVSGRPVVADLARMPHMLIAGTTGSGKSVCIAALTACLVMSNTPAELRMAMIDPKMVELVRFNGIPHLLGKVETDLERILGVLKWAVQEMDHRYRLLEQAHARDILAYNRKMEKRSAETLPRIVLIIDELADLMMTAPDQTEASLVRLAQLARAVGIHLVVATQRPSTDVITGLIKANFPARIAFTVASSIDSRVILDTTGAETLLGRGDMLFLNPEAGTPQRAQGVLIADQEIDRIITFWQKAIPGVGTPGAPWEEILTQEEDSPDSLVEQAITVIKGTRKASASLLQRKLHIGYPRAARLLDELEALGAVGPSQGGGREREVLLERDEDPEDGGDE